VLDDDEDDECVSDAGGVDEAKDKIEFGPNKLVVDKVPTRDFPGSLFPLDEDVNVVDAELVDWVDVITSCDCDAVVVLGFGGEGTLYGVFPT